MRPPTLKRDQGCGPGRRSLLSPTPVCCTPISCFWVRPKSIARLGRRCAAGLACTLLRNGWYTENYENSICNAIAHGALIGKRQPGTYLLGHLCRLCQGCGADAGQLNSAPPASATILNGATGFGRDGRPPHWGLPTFGSWPPSVFRRETFRVLIRGLYEEHLIRLDNQLSKKTYVRFRRHLFQRPVPDRSPCSAWSGFLSSAGSAANWSTSMPSTCAGSTRCCHNLFTVPRPPDSFGNQRLPERS
jgi:hypothetical protein